ncbi:MAG: S9 family peptidase [Muribaculaceae bacterium]|nr:S9 family peptidase [Muribaculaceae bacterium]
MTVILLSVITFCRAGEAGGRAGDIRPYKVVIQPDIYESQQYGSMLLLPDSTFISTADGWAARRSEICRQWMSVIGEWPAVIKGQPMQFLDSVKCDDYTRYTVSLEWLPGQTTTGYLLVPDSVVSPTPAVVTFFYEPETSAGLTDNPHRDFALQLVRHRFITLSLGSSETTADKTYGLYYPSIDNPAMESLSAMAYAAANAFEALTLDSRVDAARVGVMGHSYGGKWAMFASCLYDKFACAVWGDPGIVFDESKGGYINYWEPWYLGYRPRPWQDTWQDDGYLNREGAYGKLRADGHDLHELHALMAPRPFLVSGGYSDGPERLPVLMRTVEINRMLGYDDRVYFTTRPSHAPTPESNAVICDFFIHFLHSTPTYTH